MTEQLQRISQKLTVLKAADTHLRLFGASTHLYRLSSPVPEEELQHFEALHNITLPTEYRSFLMEIGECGAGPYYGLLSLSSTLYNDIDRGSVLIDPSKEFTFTEAWNSDYEPIADEEENHKLYKAWEQDYFDPKWASGMLRISNFGCGVSINIVVNGAEHGNIWVDDRCNDGGIYPDPHFGKQGRITFTNWYEAWLDEALDKANQLPTLPQKQLEEINPSRVYNGTFVVLCIVLLAVLARLLMVYWLP